MRFTFSGATSFTSDLSSWNVSQVTSMKRMFSGAISFNGDISTWDISNVTDMLFMFNNATSFTPENYDALLTGWSSLPSLQPNVVFGAPPTTYCKKVERDILTSNPHNWRIRGDMERSCPVVPTAPVAPFVTTWDTTEVDDPDSTKITLPIIGSEGAYDVDVSSDGHNFTVYSENFTQNTQIIDFMRQDLDLGDSKVYSIRVRPSAANTNNQLRINFGSLSSNEAQKLLKIDKWGGIVWTSMEGAFQNCSNLTIAEDAGELDLSIVTDMNNMFAGC